MDPAVAATLIGILCAALLGVFAGAFHLLRSDLRDLRTDNRETNARIDRLEGKLDGLILALAQAGLPVRPVLPHPKPPSDPES